MLYTLKFCYIFACSIVKKGIAVFKSVAMVLATESETHMRIQAKIADMVKTPASCFRYSLFESEVFCQTLLRDLTLILRPKICVGKSRQVFYAAKFGVICIKLNFTVFHPRERSWRQSLS